MKSIFVPRRSVLKSQPVTGPSPLFSVFLFSFFSIFSFSTQAMGKQLPVPKQNQNSSLPSVAQNGFATLEEAEEVAEKASKNIEGRKMILIYHFPSTNEKGQWTPTGEIHLPLGINPTGNNRSHYNVQVAWKYGGGTPKWDRYSSNDGRIHYRTVNAQRYHVVAIKGTIAHPYFHPPSYREKSVKRSLVAVHQMDDLGFRSFNHTFAGFTRLKTIGTKQTWTTAIGHQVKDYTSMLEDTTSLDDLNYILSGRSATTVKAMFRKAGTEKTRFNVQALFIKGNKITDASSVFEDTPAKLVNVNQNHFDMGEVRNATRAFKGFKHLTQLPSNLSLPKATNVTGIFARSGQSGQEVDLSNLFPQGSQVKNLTSAFLFFKGSKIRGVGNWDLSQATNLTYLFRSAFLQSYEGIGRWNVSNVTNLDSAFASAKHIDPLPEIAGKWDTRKVVNWNETFMGVRFGGGTEYLNLDTDSARSMKWTFKNAHNPPMKISIKGYSGDMYDITTMEGAYAGATLKTSFTNGIRLWDFGHELKSLKNIFINLKFNPEATDRTSAWKEYMKITGGLLVSLDRAFVRRHNINHKIDWSQIDLSTVGYCGEGEDPTTNQTLYLSQSEYDNLVDPCTRSKDRLSDIGFTFANSSSFVGLSAYGRTASAYPCVDKSSSEYSQQFCVDRRRQCYNVIGSDYYKEEECSQLRSRYSNVCFNDRAVKYNERACTEWRSIEEERKRCTDKNHQAFSSPSCQTMLTELKTACYAPRPPEVHGSAFCGDFRKKFEPVPIDLNQCFDNAYALHQDSRCVQLRSDCFNNSSSGYTEPVCQRLRGQCLDSESNRYADNQCVEMRKCFDVKARGYVSSQCMGERKGCGDLAHANYMSAQCQHWRTERGGVCLNGAPKMAFWAEECRTWNDQNYLVDRCHRQDQLFGDSNNLFWTPDRRCGNFTSRAKTYRDVCYSTHASSGSEICQKMRDLDIKRGESLKCLDARGTAYKNHNACGTLRENFNKCYDWNNAFSASEDCDLIRKSQVKQYQAMSCIGVGGRLGKKTSEECNLMFIKFGKWNCKSSTNFGRTKRGNSCTQGYRLRRPDEPIFP